MKKMTTSKIKLGIVAFILLIFSQSSLSIKAIGTIPVKLCAQDHSILFQHMEISLCSLINDELLHNTTQDKTNVQLGEICVTDEQCYNSGDFQKCLMKHCSCKEGYIEYNIQCIRGISYGEECSYSEQCNFYGGVCTRKHKCSCSFGHVYDAKGKTCHQVGKVVGATVGAGISGLIIGVLVGSVTMFLTLKKFGQDNRNNNLILQPVADTSFIGVH